MQSEYLQKFQKLQEEGKDLFKLRGNNVIVEVLPKEEKKSAGGIILTESSKMNLHGMQNFEGILAIILLAGEGYYDEQTGSPLPLDVKPGNVVLLPKNSIAYYSTFPGFPNYTANKIGHTTESSIAFYYESLDAYEQAKRLLE